jgi:hypothetical protein
MIVGERERFFESVYERAKKMGDVDEASGTVCVNLIEGN